MVFLQCFRGSNSFAIYSYFWFYKITSENVRRILITPKTKVHFFLKEIKIKQLKKYTALFMSQFSESQMKYLENSHI